MESISLFKSFKLWHILLVYILVFFIEKYISYLIVIEKTGEITYAFKWFFLNFLFYLMSNLLVIGFLGLVMFIGAYIFRLKINLKACFKATIMASFVYFSQQIFLYIWSFSQVNFTKVEFSDKFLFKLSILLNLSPRNTILFQMADGISIYNIAFTVMLIYLLPKVGEISLREAGKVVGGGVVPVILTYKLIMILTIL